MVVVALLLLVVVVVVIVVIVVIVIVISFLFISIHLVLQDSTMAVKLQKAEEEMRIEKQKLKERVLQIESMMGAADAEVRSTVRFQY